MTAGDKARGAAEQADSSTTLRTLARAGFAANGLVHVLIGVIAIGVAGGSGGSADQSGALAAISATPGGVFLLWACAAGLIGLALFQFVQAVVTREGDSTAKRWGNRIKEAAKGVAFAAIGVTAVTVALGGGSDSSQSSKSASAQLLAAPGGVFLLAAIGIAVVVIGVVFAFRGVSGRFEREIAEPGGSVGRAVHALGVVGYVAKGVVLVAVGVLLVVAAVRTDPQQAGGLDEGLKSLAELPFGVFLLYAVAVGLVAYGAYCFARARWARL